MIRFIKVGLFSILFIVLFACSSAPSASVRNVVQTGGQLRFELRVRDPQGRLEALEIRLVDEEDEIVKVLDDVDGLTEDGDWQVTMSILGVEPGLYRLLVLGDYTYSGEQYESYVMVSEVIEIEPEATLYRP